MNTWEKLEQYGRHGDTMMKTIDGEPAHVNAVEYEMSPEYIKEHGAGTINPITGKKEYFLGAIAAGVSLLGGLYRGGSAAGWWGDDPSDIKSEAQAGALDIKEEQMGIARETQGISRRGTLSAWDYAQDQYSTAMGGVAIGTGSAYGEVQDFSNTAYGKANLATSGTIEQKVGRQTSDITAKYKNEMQRLVDTRSYSEKQKDISLAGSSLQLKKDYGSAEQQYQDRLTNIEASSGPTNFWEGLFG